MPLETFAASKLVQKMLSSNASQEELYNAKKYLLAAVDYDSASLALKSVANETNIKELSKKYPLYSSWMGSSDISAKELLNLNFGVPKHEYDFSKTKVGDKIAVDLKDIGKFDATAHEVTDESVLFIFDDYITERPMNESNTNAGGYENSDLKKWIEHELFSKFPVELKARLTELTIPTVGQVVGWDDEWDKEHFEPDGDEQLPLMKKRRNRVAYFNNECEWGWLRNATKKEYSSAIFAYVSNGGDAGCNNASASHGVRPAFRVVKKLSL